MIDDIVVYDVSRKNVKKMVAQARAKSAEQFYQELESQTAGQSLHARETPRDNARIYRIAAQRTVCPKGKKICISEACGPILMKFGT